MWLFNWRKKEVILEDETTPSDISVNDILDDFKTDKEDLRVSIVDVPASTFLSKVRGFPPLLCRKVKGCFIGLSQRRRWRRKVKSAVTHRDIAVDWVADNEEYLSNIISSYMLGASRLLCFLYGNAPNGVMVKSIVQDNVEWKYFIPSEDRDDVPSKKFRWTNNDYQCPYDVRVVGNCNFNVEMPLGEVIRYAATMPITFDLNSNFVRHSLHLTLPMHLTIEDNVVTSCIAQFASAQFYEHSNSSSDYMGL